jgi:hypothetical protein
MHSLELITKIDGINSPEATLYFARHNRRRSDCDLIVKGEGGAPYKIPLTTQAANDLHERLSQFLKK